MLGLLACTLLTIAAANTAAVLDKTDLAFLAWAAQIETQQQDMGRLAQRRGGTTAVRDLGTYLLQAHRQAGAAVQDLAVRLKLHLSTRLSATHLDVQRHFQAVADSRFDRDFVRHEVGDYRYFLRHFEAAARSGNPAVRQYADGQLGELRDGQARVNAVLASLR